jgi:hypothetical protein
MADEAQPAEMYTNSDKLGIALACLAGVMAIILFLIDRTPWTVVTLLLVMGGLSIYPMVHFARQIGIRVALLLFMAIGTGLFGWGVWPKNKLSANGNSASETQQTLAANSPASQGTTVQTDTSTQGVPTTTSAPAAVTPKTVAKRRIKPPAKSVAPTQQAALREPLPKQDASAVPAPAPGMVRCADGIFVTAPKDCGTSAPGIRLGRAGKETSESQLASHIHFDRVFSPGGVDLSGCVYCSVSDSQVGTVKSGPQTGVYHNNINGKVVCEKREHPLADEPEDCRQVAVANNRTENTNAALDNTEGKIGEAYVSGNIVTPPLSGGTAKAVENFHGEIQKLTDTNNEVGWNYSTASPLPGAAVIRRSNSDVASQLSQFIDRGHKIVADSQADQDSQRISKRAKQWEADAKAALIATLEQSYADEFSAAAAPTGGSVTDEIDVKMAVLSKFVGQLRATTH